MAQVGQSTGDHKAQHHGVAGAVLVVGGGIAGIQAALDMANSGFKVYLLEESPAVGGIMAQLDKTFPTNDCAMCIMSPKLVECGRHLNIEVLSCSEIQEVTGQAGDFQVGILKRARFVNLAKCTGCGECEKACPVELASEFDEALATRKAIFRPFPQAYPNAFAIDKKARPQCQKSCPAGVHAQGYIALIAAGKYQEAYELIRRDNPFPSICGRVCHHPCEEACRRGEYDDPIAIASLKRFVADHVANNGGGTSESDRVPVEIREERIAVVGAGPAGLTCANDLADLGYSVTIFEALPVAGGMMRVGIPAYRLPREEIDREIGFILSDRVELVTNSPVDSREEIEQLRQRGYRAIFLALGAAASKRLKIDGSDLPGVLYGLDFLKQVNLGEKVKLGRRVVVIGGGNVAIDVARSCWRLGASEVHLACLESRREMPAHEWEIEGAIEEGIQIHPSWGPKRIVGRDGKITSIELIRCTSVFDAHGNFSPTFDPKTERSIGCDTVVIAIGQSPELSMLEGTGVQTTPLGTIAVDPVTLATEVEGLFAGGDVVRGPASVVEAVAHGHEAAISIDRFLKGEDLHAKREPHHEELSQKPFPTFVERKPRQVMPALPVEERRGNFREIELGYSEEMALQEAERCLECGLCSECLECERVCEADAVLHSMVAEHESIRVGSIVLAFGAEKFDPSSLYQFGYGRYPNVITSIQFERILSASGPHQGHVQRPSDGGTPKRVAWIQCVGSRDESSDAGYCSSVCCMYAMKEAVIAQEHVKGLHSTIFFMDIRAHGKDFDRYYERAQLEYGVRFVRSRVGKLEQVEDTDNIVVHYTGEDGRAATEEYDLVVLSVGFRPSKQIKMLADTLHIKLNEHGFIRTDGLSPLETSRPGVYVCGATSAPKDVPETVMQASGAAARAAELLSEARGTEIVEKHYPVEREVRGQPPRVGVFVCHCGINIGSVVDVPSVVTYAHSLPGVVYAEDNLFTCSQDTQHRIRDAIEEHGLNRVVVASCSPRTHEPLFQETLREAGLNPNLFEMANIRDQCSWVHRDVPDRATEKAKRLVSMAVAKACLLEPLEAVQLGVTQKALAIGGGLAGLVFALSVADQGFDVYLVEKEEVLGGNMRRLYRTVTGDHVQHELAALVEKVENHPRITVYKGASVESIEGYVGNFRTTITGEFPESGVHTVEHGVVLVATGAEEWRSDQYRYGEDARVISQLELERRLYAEDDGWDKLANVVMLQCVGSREDPYPYCSRVCCTQAVKNALTLKERYPKANVYVLYRDMRTYGFGEAFYRKARERGVVFIRYEAEEKPVVESDGNGGLRLEVRDPVWGGRLALNPDLVVLSPRMIPRQDAPEISQML